MKRTYLIKTLFVLFLISLILISCEYIHQDSSVDQINLLDVIFDPDVMPPHWSVANYGINKAIDPYRSPDAVGIILLSDVYPEAFGVGEEAYRFKTIYGAKSDFADELQALKQLDSFTPETWKFQSKIASESDFTCENYPNLDFPICVWIARYNRVVIEVTCSLITDRFSLTDMEKIINIVDEKASRLIENE